MRWLMLLLVLGGCKSEEEKGMDYYGCKVVIGSFPRPKTPDQVAACLRERYDWESTEAIRFVGERPRPSPTIYP